MKTNYMSLVRDKINSFEKEAVFEALEKIGYKTILKHCLLGPRNDINVWVAAKDSESIVYSSGTFSKYRVDYLDYFTEEEYKTIREALNEQR